MNRRARPLEVADFVVQLRALTARASVLSFQHGEAAGIHDDINKLQMILRRNTTKEDSDK